MSKSRGNVINPDDVVREYGADSLRLYEMFMGPLEAVKPWNTHGVEGVYRFLIRVWRLIIDDAPRTVKLHPAVQDVAPDTRDAARAAPHDPEGDRRPRGDAVQHRHLGDDGVHQPPDQAGGRGRGAVLEPFVLLLAPFAPHVAEELWRALGHTTTLAYEPWPTFDPALTKADEIEVPVQVNGKLKARLTVPAEIDDKALEAAALADETVKAADRRQDDQEGDRGAAEAGERGGAGEPSASSLSRIGTTGEASRSMTLHKCSARFCAASFVSRASRRNSPSSAGFRTSACIAFQTDTFPPESSRTSSGDSAVSAVSDTARTARNAHALRGAHLRDRGRFHVHRVGVDALAASRRFSDGIARRDDRP